MDWEVEERMSRYDDIHDYEVMVYGRVRTVRRIGNRSPYTLTPGTLMFTDCRHPLQNCICRADDITAWRML